MRGVRRAARLEYQPSAALGVVPLAVGRVTAAPVVDD
jgi:hypothetical protein